MTMIKCNGQGTPGTHSHDSVHAVRACYAGATVAATREERVTPQPEEDFVVDNNEAYERNVLGLGAAKQPVEKPATEKQQAFIERLRSERGVTILPSSHNADSDINPLGPVVYANLETMTTKGASTVIEQLLAMPKREQAAKGSAGSDTIAAGMYRTSNGDLFRVYFGQQSGRMLAKKVVGSKEDGYSFEYAGAATRFAQGATRLSLEEAKAWGKATGTCCVCSRRLDVPESVDAGIGPVCARKEGFWA